MSVFVVNIDEGKTECKNCPFLSPGLKKCQEIHADYYCHDYDFTTIDVDYHYD